jgi:MFS family permease
LLRGDSYGEILADGNYRGLWLGQVLSHLGQAIVYVAVALYVYELTGSAREVSFAIALELLPWVVAGPLAGALADVVDRRAMLVAAYLLQAGLVGLLALATTVGQVYALVFFSSLLAPVSRVAWSAAWPAIAGAERLMRGSSLDIVAENAAHVAGPIVGGWLVSLAGARPAFLAVVGCLVGAAFFSLRTTLGERGAGSSRPRDEGRGRGLGQVGGELKAGLKVLAGDPVLRYLLLLNCIVSLGWSAPSVAAVVYIGDTLGLGGGEYGLLRGTMSLSIALGVYFLGRRARRRAWRPLLAGGVIVAGVAYAAMGVGPGLGGVLGLWFAAGLGWAAFWLIDESLWARITPDGLRGRVYSLADAIIYLAEAATAVLGGWLVQWLGPAPALMAVGGAIAVGAVGLSAGSRGFALVGQQEIEEDDARPDPGASPDDE